MPLKHTLPTAIMQTDTHFIEDFLLNQRVFPSKQHNPPYPYSHSHYMTCVSEYGAIPVGSATLPLHVLSDDRAFPMDSTTLIPHPSSPCNTYLLRTLLKGHKITCHQIKSHEPLV